MESKKRGLNRQESIKTAQTEDFDLVVIGGGITGVGIALDATLRGMKVVLLEMQDFGAGTSSRSSKLIHGGLRYLKQFEFKLVREVGKERAILHKNAPHVVLPEKMLLPTVKGGTFGRLGLWFGLWFYDLLAGVKKEERRVILSKQKALATEPQLTPNGLRGAGLYSEYRTDDARLTIEVAKTAMENGAICLNYSEVKGLLYENGKVCGAKVQDRISGTTYEVKASQIVNAAGPWVDGIRKMDGSEGGKRLHHTKGVHLVVPHARLPLRQAAYIDADGGRMIFTIPRGKFTYIGTTDTNFKGDLKHPRTTQEDVDYLLKATNQAFSGAKLTSADIKSSWAGIRPLIHEDGKSPSELSRKDELFYSDTGLVTIAGGKLTGFRKMAEKVVDVISERMEEEGRTMGKCLTESVVLVGGDLGGASSLPDFIAKLKKESSIAGQEVEWLAGLYGGNARLILDEAKKIEGDEKARVVKAALRYSVLAESVQTLGDFFIRRTALLYFGRDWIAPVRDMVADELRLLLGEGHGVDPGGEFERAFADAVDFSVGDADLERVVNLS
jgi:glycerol-3-phosphate dehydrogenase